MMHVEVTTEFESVDGTEVIRCTTIMTKSLPIMYLENICKIDFSGLKESYRVNLYVGSHGFRRKSTNSAEVGVHNV